MTMLFVERPLRVNGDLLSIELEGESDPTSDILALNIRASFGRISKYGQWELGAQRYSIGTTAAVLKVLVIGGTIVRSTAGTEVRVSFSKTEDINCLAKIEVAPAVAIPVSGIPLVFSPGSMNYQRGKSRSLTLEWEAKVPAVSCKPMKRQVEWSINHETLLGRYTLHGSSICRVEMMRCPNTGECWGKVSLSNQDAHLVNPRGTTESVLKQLFLQVCLWVKLKRYLLSVESEFCFKEPTSVTDLPKDEECHA